MKINQILGRLLAAVYTAVMLAVPAQASLVGRDINGLAVAGSSAGAVFLYDTDRNITWLRNANVNGAMTWAAANTWAAGYSLGAYSGWRLPTALNGDGSGPCFGSNCTGSEMGHLWYTELGNSAGSFTNAGDFLNMYFIFYWSGTENALDYLSAWDFTTFNGNQSANGKNLQFFAMAVRPGDVLAAQVPEPESLVLALTALGALALVRRRPALGASAL